MRWQAIATLSAAAFAASGCNMVISDEPMLAREADSPMMKPGLWADASKPDCEYDLATSPESWPECADPAVVTEDGMFYTYEENKQAWEGVSVVLGKGEPTVVQVELPAALAAMSAVAPKYLYLALRARETDAAGYITEISTWMVFCGPVDDDKPKPSFEDAVTDAPFAGLTVVEGNCTAQDAGAIRNAATQSEEMADKPGLARWLRDADDVELD